MGDLNAQFADWLAEIANPRVHATTNRVVNEAFAEEQPHLIALPAHPYDKKKLVATASIAGPTTRLSNKTLLEFLPKLKRAATQLGGLDVLRMFADVE